MTYFLTFMLAFCSVVYELLLGQTLSAFLGNTVLRYSVTIGLYMFSMGIGAMLVRGRIKESPVLSLQIVEISLALIGGFSLALLFFIDYIGLPLAVLSLIAHSLIVVIGILTGLEIPLLIAIKNIYKRDTAYQVLGVDYLGAFVGTLIFAFILYPHIGLTQSAFLVAGLNSLAGTMLVIYKKAVKENEKKAFGYCLLINTVLLAAIIFCAVNAVTIDHFFIDIYLA